ncbi:MAG: preprotein translocase subunit SecG [Pseudomonadota bacterium]
METVLIVIHLMIVLALVAVVLMQRSEGGGLGIGGGGGNLASSRAAANPLARLTTYLGIAFFVTSVALGLLARYGDEPGDVLDRIPSIGETQEDGTVPAGSGGVLDLLGGEAPPAPVSAPQAPTGDEAAPSVPNDADSDAPAVPAVPN